MGIEPTSKAWEALILPMNYARLKISVTILKILLARAMGIESLQRRRVGAFALKLGKFAPA